MVRWIVLALVAIVCLDSSLPVRASESTCAELLHSPAHTTDSDRRRAQLCRFSELVTTIETLARAMNQGLTAALNDEGVTPTDSSESKSKPGYLTFDKRKHEYLRFGKRKNEYLRFGK